MKRLIGLLLVLVSPCLYGLDVSSLSLADCEQDALKSSAHLQDLQAQVRAARAQQKGVSASLYPSISLDAKGSWVSDVPTLTLGNSKLQFGDNWGYSVGPTASYVLFDNGGRSSLSNSASKMVSAQEQAYEFARKQILLQVRQAYFAVQQQLQHLVLLNGQLEVVQKQLADVQSSYQAGAKSKLDITIAQKQVLKTQAAMSAARSNLAGDLRTLFELTGTDYGINPTYPTDKRLIKANYPGNTSAVLATDSLDSTLGQFLPYGQSEFDENSPKLAALDEMAQYYAYLADSYKASLYPRLALQGGAYFEYPNGAIRGHVFLGRAGAAVSLPLFEGGKNRRQAQAQQVNSYITQILAKVAAHHGYQLGGPTQLALDTRILFNPQLSTTDFMVPALLVMTSFIILMIVGSMAITKEKEMGTMEKLISSPASTADILLGKVLPYFFIGIGVVTLMLGVGVLGFGIPFRGTFWQFALNGIALAACALSMATLISTIASSQQQAMMGGVLVLLPAVLLSGVFFPVDNIPVGFRWICYLNPMMYACTNFRNIILKGGDYLLFGKYFGILLLMAVTLATLAYKNFKSKLN